MSIKDIKQYNISQGMKVICEKYSINNIVSIGLFIKSGSMYDTGELNGVAHLVEHMASKKFMQEISGVGAKYNAISTKEFTVFYIKTISDYIDEALDALSKVLKIGSFKEDDVELNKSIVINEIKEYQSNMDNIITDKLLALAWGYNSLTNPTLGSEESIKGCTTDKLYQFYTEFYTTDNSILSIVGDINEDLMTKIDGYFSDCQQHKNSHNYNSNFKYNYLGGIEFVDTNSDIVRMRMAYPFVDKRSNYYYDALIANEILGGSVQSRLYRTIRETHGLAYRIYSTPIIYNNNGIIYISIDTAQKEYKKTYDCLIDVLGKIVDGGITDEEFENAKKSVMFENIESLETTSGRMTFYGKSLLLQDFILDEGEIISRFKSSNIHKINNILKNCLKSNMTYIVSGQK